MLNEKSRFKKTGLLALLAIVGFSDGWAGTVTNYTIGDVLVCFRKGGNDMVVDAGPISAFTGAAANQRIPITQYTGAQLAQVGTNSVSWSAFAWLSDNTLFVTRARATLGTQTTPWPAQSGSTQSGTAARMATIPPGALDELTLLVYPVSTPTAVVEEDSSAGNPNYTDGVSYHDALAGSYGGNFNGTFVGNPENTTPANFTSSGNPVRSDFYQMTPTGGFAPGTWLGYFELATNGAITYVAYPSTTPAITSLSHSGTATTVTYTTGQYGTYTLRGTNGLTYGSPPINWPAITTLTSGDKATHSTEFTATNDCEFYIITAQ